MLVVQDVGISLHSQSQLSHAMSSPTTAKTHIRPMVDAKYGRRCVYPCNKQDGIQQPK